MRALLNSLNEDELALVREADGGELAALDEDGLVDLHERVRRARNKYAKLYRRTASARVEEYGGRGAARPKNRRNAQRAEVFEDVLARVSWHLARAARRSAGELKARRIADAAPGRAPAPGTAPPAARRMTAQTTPRRRPSGTGAAGRQQAAASRAKGARRQGRRDSR